jgi:hypothetical protein
VFRYILLSALSVVLGARCLVLTRSLTHSPAHPLTRSLTHSLTRAILLQMR